MEYRKEVKDLNTKNGGNTVISNTKAYRHERKVEKDGTDCWVGVFSTVNQPSRIKWKSQTQSMVFHDAYSVLHP